MVGFMVGVVMIVSIFFSQVINPMILSFLVVFMGGAVMLYLGLLLISFWVSYIVLLTFLGGLLVVFVYVSSLCPNEPIMKLGGWGWLIVLGGFMVGGMWWSGGDMGFIGGREEMSFLMKMYGVGEEVVVSLLVVYLLLVLLVVVDLSLISEGCLSVYYGSTRA